jgi:hypothetical protein
MGARELTALVMCRDADLVMQRLELRDEKDEKRR